MEGKILHNSNVFLLVPQVDRKNKTNVSWAIRLPRNWQSKLGSPLQNGPQCKMGSSQPPLLLSHRKDSSRRAPRPSGRVTKDFWDTNPHYTRSAPESFALSRSAPLFGNSLIVSQDGKPLTSPQTWLPNTTKEEREGN